MVELSADFLLPPGAGPTWQQIAALDGAIVAAFPAFGPLVKDGENTYSKSKYIKPETLLNDVRPALFAQSILISSCLQLVKGGFVVTTTLTHVGGGWRSSSFPVGSPNDASKVSASVTKGKRINLLALLEIVGREDDGSDEPYQQQSGQPATAAWQATPPMAALTPGSAAWPGPGGNVPQPVVVPGPDGRAVTLPPGSPDPYSNQIPADAWHHPHGAHPAPGPQPPANSQFV
jgi:hypothetical protein